LVFEENALFSPKLAKTQKIVNITSNPGLLVITFCNHKAMPLQLMTFIRYIAGPFPESLCSLSLILQNVFTMKAVVFLNCIAILRYIFTFHSKNPTAVQVPVLPKVTNIGLQLFATCA
jgi:hypothetical protein